MGIYFLVFVISLFLSLILTPLVRDLVKKLGIASFIPKDRDVHKSPIPRVGGIAIFIAFMLPIGSLALFMPAQTSWGSFNLSRFAILFLLCFSIFLLGLIDDIWSLRAGVKFIAQLIIATLFAVFYAKITTVGNPLMSSLIQLGWLSLPFTILWIVGITNAFNLIDGIDGLASGSALFTTLMMIAIAITTGNYELVIVMCALAGGIFGFLRYNFNPATIFLGDCGSLFIGFTIAALSVLGTQKGSTLLAISIPILACGFPILETALSIIRRFLSGKPIFGADKGHIHHQLLAKGFSQRQAVLILYGVSTLFALLGLFVNYTSNRALLFALLACCIVIWMLVRQLGYVEFNELGLLPQKLFQQRQVITNNIRMRQELHLLNEVQDFNQLFNRLEDCFRILEVANVEIEIPITLTTIGEIENKNFAAQWDGNTVLVKWPNRSQSFSADSKMPRLSLYFQCANSWGHYTMTFSENLDYQKLPFDFSLLSQTMPKQIGDVITRLIQHESIQPVF